MVPNQADIARPRRCALYGGPLDGERIVWRMSDAQGCLRFHPPVFNGVVLVRPHLYRLTGIDEPLMGLPADHPTDSQTLAPPRKGRARACQLWHQ